MSISDTVSGRKREKAFAEERERADEKQGSKHR
jgi:hypothetical protein